MNAVQESQPEWKLRYQLEEEELLECFLCLDSPKESRAKLLNEAVLTILAILFVARYALCPAAVYNMFLAVALIAALLAIRYVPSARRRRLARRLARQAGTYELTIRGGRVKGAGTPLLEMDGKECRFYESRLAYTLLLGKGYCFCIPKRVLTDSQQADLRLLLVDRGLVTVAADFAKNRKGR